MLGGLRHSTHGANKSGTSNRAWPIGHGFQCTDVSRVGGRIFHARGRLPYDGGDPLRKLRVQPVVDPQPLAPVGHQSRFPELAKMAGYVGLGGAGGVGEFADAEFLELEEKQQAAETRVVRHRREQGFGRYIHAKEYTLMGIYHQPNV